MSADTHPKRHYRHIPPPRTPKSSLRALMGGEGADGQAKGLDAFYDLIEAAHEGRLPTGQFVVYKGKKGWEYWGWDLNKWVVEVAGRPVNRPSDLHYISLDLTEAEKWANGQY